MKVLLFSLLLMSKSADATVYTLGTVEDWSNRLQAAVTFLEAENQDLHLSLDPQTISDAAHVIGFLEGLREGSIYSELLKLSTEQLASDDAALEPGFCMEDAYFEMPPKLIDFIQRRSYPKESDFAGVLAEFLREEYAC